MYQNMYYTILLTITIAAVVCTAREKQEGEENATCFPADFESYRWVLAGNTWFAETRAPAHWLTIVDECENIDPGRTSIGGPRNALENKRLKDHFRDGHYYFNAIQIGEKRWYWYTQKSEKPGKVEKVTWANWYKGEPNNVAETCGDLYSDKKWNDSNCGNNWRGVCELRCDSL